MPVEYAGSTPVASRLLRYTVKPKPGQTLNERVLHIIGQHCRPETAEREFAMTRRKHGTQGATRKSPAKYELPEPGEVATHIRKTRPNGRRYWAVTRDGETATHMRREGDIVKQAEARHLITSFAVDEVNPDDPDQVARAFAYTVARHKALYPGEQATFVGQAEGKGGKFHVHTTRNATLFADMEMDGKLYKAGSKLAGDLTDIGTMRDRADAFLAEHGAEYGLGPQRLAPVKDQKRDRRSVMDRRMAAKGEISNHDMIREAFESSMDDPRTVDLNNFVDVMAELGVEVTAPGWRRGKPPKIHRLSYKTAHMGTPVRGDSLGERYDHAGAVAQLVAKAAGQVRERRPVRVQAGPPRSVAVPTAEELAEAQAFVVQLAREERLHAWLDDWAREEYVTVEEMLAERELSLDIEEDRELLHTKMLDWEAAQQAAPPSQPGPQTHPIPLKSDAHARAQANPEPQQPERAKETSESDGFPNSEEPPSATGRGFTGDINNAAEARAERGEGEAVVPGVVEHRGHLGATVVPHEDTAHSAASAQTAIDFTPVNASPAQPQCSNEIPEQPKPIANLSAPGTTSISGLRDTQATPASGPEAVTGPETDAAAPEAQEVASEAKRLQELNARLRRINLPEISLEKYAENQAIKPELREWRLKNPELFDETTPAADPGEQGRAFRD